MPKDNMKLLIVASEAVPFAKVGGLADVVGALGKEIRKNGIDVRIIMPKYSIVKDYLENRRIPITVSTDFTVTINGNPISGKIQEIDYEGIKYCFIDNPYYFERDGIYIDSKTKNDFSDSLERFTFFCKAVLESCKAIGFKPDIIQSNDWQTGLVPVYLKSLYRWSPALARCSSVLPGPCTP